MSFIKLAKTLIQNKMWASQIEYFKRERIPNGISFTYKDNGTLKFTVVIRSVSKALVDNVNILNTDVSIVLDAISLNASPTIDDLININGSTYKIVQIKPLGTLNNKPVAYELIIRLA